MDEDISTMMRKMGYIDREMHNNILENGTRDRMQLLYKRTKTTLRNDNNIPVGEGSRLKTTQTNRLYGTDKLLSYQHNP